MVFTVFKKTGELRDKWNEWDGDEGYYEDCVVDDKKVQYQIAKIIADDYVAKTVNQEVWQGIYDTVNSIIDDMCLLETFAEFFKYDLQEWVQEQYDNQ